LVYPDELSQVLTAKDIFSFVNNIPFIEDYKKPDLIASPDFTVTQNKGTLTDHVVLLACMMMGCNYETMDEVGNMKQIVDQYRKEMVSFENRTFICVGTNKFSKRRELWLMTYDRDLTSVTMWDVRSGMCYELQGRVNDTAIMRKYLTYDPSKDLDRGDTPLMELLAKYVAEDMQDEKNDDEDNSGDGNSSVHINLDNILPQEENEAIIDPEMIKKLNKYTAAENEMKVTGFDWMNNKDRFANKGATNTANMNARHDFFVNGTKVTSLDLIPWGSIELIFNHKNIWANIQHQNPSKIMYEISNPNMWRPFLAYWDGKVEMPWLNKVGSFHCISNLEAPIQPEEITAIETMVLKDIKFTINCQRSGLNLESKFRSPVKFLLSIERQAQRVAC
jgi:hypothetical protein